MTSVAAIVVNHEREEMLRDCLASLTVALDRVAGPTEVIVVDNASRDGSREAVRAEFPEVSLIELGANRGFPTAVNAGLALSNSEWVLLVNNDATLEPRCVSRLLQASEDCPGVGALAAQMRFAATPGRINSAGIEVDGLGVASDRLLGAPVESSETEPVEVFGASAGAALYRRSMLDQIGGFDGSFFAFLEDADVAWRARAAGWSCLYVPGAIVFHHHSATAGHGSPFKHFHVGLNRVRLLAKDLDERQLRRRWPAILAYDVSYVLFVAISDRSLAPLRGRLAGLREWRRYRESGASTRRPVALAPIGGPSAALRRRSAWRARRKG